MLDRRDQRELGVQQLQQKLLKLQLSERAEGVVVAFFYCSIVE